MRIEIKIDDAGGFDEIEVVELFVEPGADVKEGEAILELATDKANQEIDAPQAGKITDILVEAGDIIAPDRVLAVLETVS